MLETNSRTRTMGVIVISVIHWTGSIFAAGLSTRIKNKNA